VPPKAITRRAREDQSQQNHVGDCRGDSLLVDELRPYKHRSRQLDSIRSVRRYLVLERRIAALYCAGARIAQSAEEAGVGEKAEKNETERERASCQANTKRNQKLFDQRTRIDIECNRATEELHIATGRIEQLHNERVNFRAEKKIWKLCYSNFLTRFGVLIVDLGCTKPAGRGEQDSCIGASALI